MKRKPLSSIATTIAFVVLSASGVPSFSQSSKIAFKERAISTGWIDFDYQDGKRIFVPVTINGHKTEALLVTGLPVSDIDKAFASSIGSRIEAPSNPPKSTDEKPTNVVHGLNIQIGNLTLQNTDASAVDFGPLAKHIGHDLPLMLGDDVFNGLAVDIDFAHHRIAFTDPSHQVKPDGAATIPLMRVEDTALVPVSIEGAPVAQFELGIGNSSELLVYQSYYDSHKLLEGRRLSRRLAMGSGGIIPEPVGTLKTAEFAGYTFPDMPAAFIPTSLAGTKSEVIAGDLGLPILARFRLIIDYSHNRVYAIPYANAIHEPLAKDRLGLWLNKGAAGVTVEFVAPNSPAQLAGFKTGDKVGLIDGKPADAWSEAALTDLRYAANGKSLSFTMRDGSLRQVKLADYF